MLLETLFLLHLFILEFVHSNADFYLRRDHSMMKPYPLDSWNIVGHTVVTTNYVRLTPDQRSKTGQIWNNVPCNMRNWEAHVHFKVHGHDKGELHGDGFAFWYTRESMQVGHVFGSKDYYEGLAVYFDTYSNHNGVHSHVHPYISAMVNNGTMHYDHDKDGTHTQLGGCTALFRNIDTETFAAIRYENGQLTVSTDMTAEGKWRPCFSIAGVHLPTGYYFGVSAATGDLSDNHDIISIRIYELATPEKDQNTDFSDIKVSADYYEEERDHVDADPPFFTPSIKRMFVFVLVFVTVGGVAFGAYMWWMNNQHQRSKRLY